MINNNIELTRGRVVIKEFAKHLITEKGSRERVVLQPCTTIVLSVELKDSSVFKDSYYLENFCLGIPTSLSGLGDLF